MVTGPTMTSANSHDILTIASYNLHGLNQGRVLLLDLCNDVTASVIFIQEHWLTPANMYQLSNLSPNYSVFGMSAMENAVSQSVLRGRPYGGVATLVHNKYIAKTICLKCDDRFVIVAIEKFIFINVYLPCNAPGSDSILDNILANIYDIVSLYPDYKIVFGGDLNTSLSVNSKATKSVREFMNLCYLTDCNDVMQPNCNYTYCHDTLNHFSTLDYLMVSSSIIHNDLIRFQILDNMINLSDHLPVLIAVNFRVDNPDSNKRQLHGPKPDVETQRRLRWDYANLADYYALSYRRLQPILNDLVEFQSHLLRDDYFNHGDNAYQPDDLNGIRNKVITAIEEIYCKLTATLYDIAKQTIPTMHANTLKFWWNDELQRLKRNAISSHNAWLAAGKPATGVLMETKRHDKYAYKLAIRKNKNDERDGITNSLYNAMENKNSNEFWKVWNSKLGTRKVLPTCVDGKRTECEIAQEFAKYFSSACSNNSLQRNQELMRQFNARKADYVGCVRSDEFLLSIERVDKAISKLKLGKSSGLDNITAEHIVYAHPIIVQIFQLLFNLLIKYEYVPNDFGINITVPILKSDTGRLCNTDSCDNYRGISVCPIISKVFEHCLLDIFHSYFISSDMQFGFKAKTGCTNALYCVRKTIEFFIERESTVNICSLDMAKAFDKMNKYALFIKLLNNNCPLTLINLLDCWYAKSYACIRWGSALSSIFQMNSGTRQGGVCSPALFAVFINDVLHNLQKSSLGCHIHCICFNAFMFADDLILLSISIADLQAMVDICRQELDWLDMCINIKKSMCLRIGNRFNEKISDIFIDNKPIVWTNEIRYLGIYIVAGRSFKCNLHSAKIKFFRSLNGILGKVGSSPPLAITLSLVASNCNPILLYGLEALRLLKSQVNCLNYPFNSAFMKLFQTFDKNVIHLTQYYCGYLPFKQQLDLRTLNFLLKLKTLDFSPSSILYHWFGKSEFNIIATQYDITDNDTSVTFNQNIWSTFAQDCLG